jgi:hypothetical protein
MIDPVPIDPPTLLVIVLPDEARVWGTESEVTESCPEIVALPHTVRFPATATFGSA